MLDIHTHHLLFDRDSLEDFSSDPEAASLLPEQPFSAGIHPWDTLALTDFSTRLATLEELLLSPHALAVGECGVDLAKGGPLFRQLQLFRCQVELSERLGKPLIIHCVKGTDIILGLRRDLRPRQNWLIHGFRGKPATAAQLVKAGIWLSFGEKFNPETLRSMPEERILAETDDSQLSINEIVSRLSECRGTDLLDICIANAKTFLSDSD